MQTQSISRRALIKASAALAAVVPFLRAGQAANAATSQLLGLASTHPVGKTKLYTSVNPNLFVTRTGVNTWVAIDNICTHAGARINGIVAKQIQCQVHGYRFDPATGKCTNARAGNLRSYVVTIRKGKIYVSI